MWMQARAKMEIPSSELAPSAFDFEQEFTVLYYDSYTFQKEYVSGQL